MQVLHTLHTPMVIFPKIKYVHQYNDAGKLANYDLFQDGKVL
jgi:hypothetical protein